MQQCGAGLVTLRKTPEGQGTALGRAGRVHISTGPDGAIWVAGATVTCVSGQVEL